MTQALFKVGERYSQFAVSFDSIKFDISDSGAVLYVLMANPSEREVRQYRANNPFQIRFCVLDGVVFLLFRFGDLPWVDTPYHAGLSLNLSTPPDIAPGEGLALHVMLANSSNGELKALRLISLGEEFSKKLLAEAKRQFEEKVTKDSHDTLVSKLYKSYSTNDMLSMAINRWKLTP